MTSAVHRAVFAESGHFTAMHNVLFDWVQPRLSLSAWSVLCVVVRRTRGWGKKYDAISYGQIMEATGIKSSATVAKALNELLCDSPFGKPILRRQKSAQRTASCREATRYALNPSFELSLLESRSQRPEAREEMSECEGGEYRGREEGLTAEARRRREEDSFATIEVSALEANSVSSSPNSSSPFLGSSALEIEGRDGVRALDFEAPDTCSSLENEETKEPPGSYRVENSKCENAHASASALNSPLSSSSSPLFASVCAATLRDPAVVSAKMHSQLVACAHRLEGAGYRSEHIERAAQNWPYPTAPTPAQLLDNIAALLRARPHRAKPSNPAAPAGAALHAPVAARSGGNETNRPPRFECAAQRKSRKWADWLSEIGEES